MDDSEREFELLKKLDSEQLKEFLLEREKTRAETPYSNWEDILVPFIVFATPVLIVGIIGLFSYREKQLVHGNIANHPSPSQR